MTALLIIIFLTLMLIGMPIAFALGISTILALIFLGYDPIIFFHRMSNSISSFSMIAVPLYILAGNLCGMTGITKRLVKMCITFVGHIPGGTGIVNIMASIFFGGISGSAVADTSAIGGMLIPVMKQEGYDKGFSGGITISSSTIGILIPPSIPQCLYGICAGVSIGAMFMAGIIPGLLVGIMQIIVCYFLSRKRNYPKQKKSSYIERLSAIKEASLALGMPLIILIGCGTGIVTASEAGVIAVLYSILIGLLFYKELEIRNLPEVFINSIITSSVALYIVGIASVVSWVINIEDVPKILVDFLELEIENDILVIIAINLILFIFGCFMDLVPVMLLFAPIFLPIAQNYGISPIQFGIIMTINLGIGLVTPPVGNCLFIASGIAETSTIRLFQAALPFIMCNLLCLLLVHIFPSLTTFLPKLFNY